MPLPLIISEDYESVLSYVKELFQDMYEKEYTYRLDSDIELVGIHLIGQADIGKIKLAKKTTNRSST